MQAFDENGNPLPQYPIESKRVIAGILGILLGSLGVHKFVLGYTNQGLIILAITIVTCGIGAAVTSLIGLIEGIIYLTKSDEEFIELYQTNKKEWF
jgi:TM2 domain-containing membrane protein YozV